MADPSDYAYTPPEQANAYGPAIGGSIASPASAAQSASDVAAINRGRTNADLSSVRSRTARGLPPTPSDARDLIQPSYQNPYAP
jgi:hypothetical protein